MTRREPGQSARRLGAATALVLSAVIAVALALSSQPVVANWLTRALREAGETATSSGARLGRGDLDEAAARVRTLPGSDNSVVVAAHVSPEGHWTFANRDGEVFTAASAGELTRVLPTLFPSRPLSDAARPAVYLSGDTVFQHAGSLVDLRKAWPDVREWHLVSGPRSYRLIDRPQAGADGFAAEVRPHVVVSLAEGVDAFHEAVWHLSRAMNRADIRLLSLTPGGPQALPSVPRFDRQTGRAAIDTLDPDHLVASLRSVRGQTILLVGQLESGRLIVRPASGPPRSFETPDLVAAARAADVNLVLLASAAAQQPGGRNWLWQRVEVDGLDTALARATFADFLDVLGGPHGTFVVTASMAGRDRVILRAEPVGPAGPPDLPSIGDWMGDVATSVTGSMVTSGVTAHLRSAERQTELDARLIPGVPSAIQLCYLGGLVAGLFGFGVVRAWWAFVWPPELRDQYTSALGYSAAGVARWGGMVLLFMPLFGLPALAATLMLQVWWLVSAPWRLLRWTRGRAQTEPRPVPARNEVT